MQVSSSAPVSGIVQVKSAPRLLTPQHEYATCKRLVRTKFNDGIGNFVEGDELPGYIPFNAICCSQALDKRGKLGRCDPVQYKTVDADPVVLLEPRQAGSQPNHARFGGVIGGPRR